MGDLDPPLIWLPQNDLRKNGFSNFSRRVIIARPSSFAGILELYDMHVMKSAIVLLFK